MPDYKNSKIYKIVDANEEMVYIGSTTKTLSARMAGHRYEYKLKPNTLSCHLIFEKYGVENCKILLIELYSCNTKEELLKKEGEYISKLKCINKQIAGCHINNDDYMKQYYLAHAEKIKERTKQYHIKKKQEKQQPLVI